MEPPVQRYYDLVERMIARIEKTPEPVEVDWSKITTPEGSIPKIQEYSEYIDKRIYGAIDGSIPLSPTVTRVIEKRNKAQNIIVYTGVLSSEELTKRKADEARRKKHKKEGGSRRVKTDHGVIKKGDALLRICKRNEFLQQQKNLKIIEYDKKISKLVDYRWGVTVRAAVRWSNSWQNENRQILK
ncbi:hypothetical protein DL95DRAFT_390374 [Leptodontidium sp. 2 PMI_412]|nr:hypothetical protein DL95DRAFT_390374 [Leptodontidium sp. 2 PMI_412]